MNGDSIDEIIAQIRAQFPPTQFARVGMDELLSMYAVLVLTSGIETTNRDVHNVWMIWARRYEPESPDIIPYEELSQAVQDEDSPFAQAIRTVAMTLK